VKKQAPRHACVKRHPVADLRAGCPQPEAKKPHRQKSSAERRWDVGMLIGISRCIISGMGDIDTTARRMRFLSTAALTVLLARVGGSVAFTEAEYREVVERYGGAARLTLRLEQLKGPGESESIRAAIVRNKPRQGDLPV
jgi:hypothetical protein